jgi:uncharacterized surface protein with fasciclin (FAS1) repeats
MRFSLVIDGKVVDLFSDETIQLTRAIKDFLTTQARTDFTQQFNIPSTSVNDPIFDNYFDENSVLSGWNAYVKLDAIIYIHSIPIFNGCVELTGVEYKNGLPRQYNLIFYGQGKTAIADFGEKTLPMVNWTAYNHTVNYSNVIDSWFGTLLSGKVLYPVADWHIGLSYCKVPVIDNNLYQGGLAINDLRPALLLSEMVKACFLDIGYTLSGTLFDRDNFNDLFVIPMNGAGPVQNTANLDAKIDVRLATLTTTASYVWRKVIFNTETLDPLNLYNTTTALYTVPFTGLYKLQLSGIINAPLLNKVFFRANWKIGGTQEFTEPTTTGFFSSTIEVQMSKGDLLQIDVVTYAVNTFNDLKFEIIEVPFGIIGTTLNFGVTMPPMKVSDFINGFLKTFNAVLIPVGATEFALHNIDDYYALGVKKDWTRYIDMVDIKHEKVPIPKQITMSHAEAEDIANVQYTSVNNQAFGSMKASPEVDFADEALEIESPFTLLVPSLIREKNLNNQLIRDTELQIPVLLDGDFKPVKADLYLAYFVERRTIAVDTYQLEGIDQFSYPLISSYQDFPTTSATNSLAFGMEATISGNAPTNTLYVEFFRSYLSRVMSSKSRIVYFSSVLPVNEWLQLEMNDTISVSGNLYKIQNIQYDILNERAELVLISYPNINVQTYTSTGNNTGWTNGATNTDGLTTLNGDAVGRGVTNSKPQFGGGTGVTVLGQKTFGQTNMQKVRDIVNELVKDRSVAVVFNSDPVTIVTPTDNSYIKVGLNTVQSLGNSFYFTNASGSVTINASARYKATAEISIVHPKNKILVVSILINGLQTTAFADLEKNDFSTAISEVFDLTEGSIVEVAFACLENHATTIQVLYCKLRLEKI